MIDRSSKDVKATRSLYLKESTRISLLIPSESLGKVLSRTPGRNRLRVPVRDFARPPGRDLSTTPGWHSLRIPVRDLVKNPGRDPSRTPGRNRLRVPVRDLVSTPVRNLARTPGRDLARTPGRDLSRTPGRHSLRIPVRDLARTAGRGLSRTSGRHLSKTPGRDHSRTSGRDPSRTSRRLPTKRLGQVVTKKTSKDIIRVIKVVKKPLSPSSARTKTNCGPAGSSTYPGAPKAYTKPSRSTVVSVVKTKQLTRHLIKSVGASKSKDIKTKKYINSIGSSETGGGDMSKTKDMLRAVNVSKSSPGYNFTKIRFSSDIKQEVNGTTEKSHALRWLWGPAATTTISLRSLHWTWYYETIMKQSSTCRDKQGYRVRCTTTRRRYRPRKKTKQHNPKSPRPTFTRWFHNEKPISTTYYDDDTTSLTTTVTSQPGDIDKLLLILDNLTYIYDTDLVKRFNGTLQEKGYPYCPSSATAPSSISTGTTRTPTDNLTGAVVSKCFVCGMTVPGIPERPLCADSFAGDFFPTAPIDFTARGHIDSFRKHCRYLQIGTWYINGTKDKFMWGKWSGGCSVRWVDLSGVYTQRTCRNSMRPSMGKHFGSKRMAMLEKALVNEKDACIISPQASLLPFSRGVSLYARFHACVCSGNYCNQAERLTPLSVLRMVLFTIAERLMNCLLWR